MIYFVQNPVSKHIKIGSTSNIDRRLSELQIANSTTLRVLYVIDIPEEESLMFEKHVQGVCQLFAVQGEWFEPGCIDHLLRHPWYKKNMRSIERQ